MQNYYFFSYLQNFFFNVPDISGIFNYFCIFDYDNPSL